MFSYWHRHSHLQHSGFNWTLTIDVAMVLCLIVGIALGCYIAYHFDDIKQWLKDKFSGKK